MHQLHSKSATAKFARLFVAGILLITGCMDDTKNSGSTPPAGNNTSKDMSAVVDSLKNNPALHVSVSDSNTGTSARADVMPRPDYDFKQFLINNVKYPEEAKRKGITGRVMVGFVIDKDGSITDPVIIHSPDTLLSVEALRIVREMPKWVPGFKNGKPVPVYFTLPLVFKL